MSIRPAAEAEKLKAENWKKTVSPQPIRPAAEAESRASQDGSGGVQRSCKCWVDRRKGDLFTFSTIHTRLIIAQQLAYAYIHTAQTTLPRRHKLNEFHSCSENKNSDEKSSLFVWAERGGFERQSRHRRGSVVANSGSRLAEEVTPTTKFAIPPFILVDTATLCVVFV